jgi:hypothetical protein
MANKEATKPAEIAAKLGVMLGTGDMLEAQGKKYKILPLKLKEVDEFLQDNMIVGDAQFFNISNKDSRANLDKWLKRKVSTADGEPLTVEQAMEDDWDLDDLKACIRALIRLSG